MSASNGNGTATSQRAELSGASRRKALQPILWREDRGNSAPATGKASAPESRDVSAKGLEIMGLCGTCDALATCTRAKPHGGVWRCHDYSDTYESVYE